MSSNRSILQKLASQTVVYGLSSMLGRLLNYLLVPLHTRVLPQAEYGTNTELYSYIGLLMVLYTYGMETAFFRHIKESAHSKEVYSTAFWSLLGSTTVVSLVFLLLISPFSTLLDYENHPHYLLYVILILAFDTVSTVPFAWLRYHERPARFVTVRLLSIGLNIGFNLFFFVLCPLWYDQSVWIQRFYIPDLGVEYIFISNVLASGLTLVLLLPELLQVDTTFSTSLWKRMLIYGSPLVVVGLAGSINEVLGRISLKYLLPYDTQTNLALLGIYGACYKLSILMSLFTQAFRFAAEPFFFSQSTQQNATSVYAMVMHYFIIVGVGIFLLVMLFIDTFKHFIGDDYQEGLVVVPILLLANLLLGVYYNLSVWYKLTNRTGSGAVVAVIGTLFTIALNASLIPLWGYVGSAWATLVCYTVMALISVTWGQRYYPIPYRWGQAAGYLILAVGLWQLSAYLSSNFSMNDWLRYGFQTVCLLAYVGAVWFNERRGLVVG